MLKKKNIGVAILLAAVAVFCGILVAPQAGAVSYTGGGVNDSANDTSDAGCKNYVESGRWWNDDCAGASWRLHPLASDGSNTIIRGADGKSVAATILTSQCKAVGATHYYLLAWEKWRGTKPNYQFLGQQVGAVNVKWMARMGGADGHSTKYIGPSTLSGVEDWDTVYGDFLTAQKFGATFNKSWNDTSWFCWNVDWRDETSESSFAAWSFISSTSTSNREAGADTPDFETVTKNYVTQADTFNVVLWHQMSYNRPKIQGTYGPATTNWRTEVTIDGQIQNDKSVTNPRALVNNDSGPGGSAWWSEFLGVQNIQVKVPESGSVEVCSRIIYEPKNIKWKENNGRFDMDSAASSGTEDSRACVTVGREEVETEQAGQIRFISRSTVQATGASGIQRSATSNDEGEDTVTLYLSTTKSEIDATFYHELMYKYEARGGGAVEPIEAKDEFRNADQLKVDWEVYRSSDDRSDGEINKIINTGTMFYDTSPQYRNGKSWQKVSGNNTYRIRDIKEGETVVVCEEISFEDATIWLDRDEVRRQEKTYASSSTYMNLPMYTREDNPNPMKREEENDDINGGKYLFKAATIYHTETVASTCRPGLVGTPPNQWTDPCATGKPEHIEYKSGGVIGQTAYRKIGNTTEKTGGEGDDKRRGEYEIDSNFTSDGLYVNDYSPASAEEIADDTIMTNLGFYTRSDATAPNGTHYFTYSSASPMIAEWHEGYWIGGWEADWQGNPFWNDYHTWHDGWYTYRAYDKERDGASAQIVSSTGETLYTPNHDLVHDHWIYYPVEGQPIEEGKSKACLSVTRPEDPLKPGDTDPQTNLPVTGPVSGSPDSGFIYAGEVGDNVSWNGYATSYATRRLMEAQAVVYDPKVNVDPYDDISKGNLFATDKERELYNNNLDTCSWYLQKKYGGDRNRFRNGCAIISEVGGSWGEGYNAPYTHDSTKKIYNATTSADVIISDYVGDKYCNSFGFKLEYWYGITHSNPVSEEWHSEGKSYWAIYDAACRTIAKKPALNLWNGSLFTNGDVQTTIANRYLNPVFGGTVINPRGSGNRNNFGSWSEYLAVVGGIIYSEHTGGFGSGTALSFNGAINGLGIAGEPLWNISPLTVSNVGPTYGLSGVEAGSTFRARLATYLKSLATTSSADGLQNVDHTVIVNAGGTLDITQDITLADTGRTYPSIYQLPQIIIFADDINIHSNVTRIDAWLIAKNRIDTCFGFKDGKTDGHGNATEPGTPAHVKDYNDRNLPICSNQLTINGPIIAKSIDLNRSYGSDPITNTSEDRPTAASNKTNEETLGEGTNARAIPGEAFNLSADAYLWAYAQAGRYDSSYTEAYTRELPPRY